jgi:hypothetical protein
MPEIHRSDLSATAFHGAGTQGPQIVAVYALVVLALGLFLGGNVVLWFVGRAPEGSVAPNLASKACVTCSYTLGDKAATAGVSQGAVASLVLAPEDLPAGFTLIDDESLTDDRIAKDEQKAQQLRDAGHLSGWWRSYRNDARQIEVVSGANLYANTAGATALSDAGDTPASFVDFPSNGKFRAVLAGVVFGDQSNAYVFESPDDPLVTAYIFFRVGSVNEWVYVTASSAEFSPVLFVRLIYAQLAHSYNGRR